MKKRPLVFAVIFFVLGEAIGNVIKTNGLIILIVLTIVLVFLGDYSTKNNTTEGKRVRLMLIVFFIIGLSLGFVYQCRKKTITKFENIIETSLKTNTLVKGKVVRINDDDTIVVKTKSIKLDSYTYNKKYNVLVQTDEIKEFKIGIEVILYGEVSLFSKSTNPGQFDQKKYYNQENINFRLNLNQYQIYNNRSNYFLEKVRNTRKILINQLEKLTDEKNFGILSSIVFGDKTLLEDSIKKLFQKSGIAHIFAISGLHISFIGGTIYKLFRKTGSSFFKASIFSSIILVIYGISTGLSVSTIRAIIMIFVFFLREISGRDYDLLSSASIASVIILIFFPYKLTSPGFILSFFAVIGVAFGVEFDKILLKKVDK